MLLYFSGFECESVKCLVLCLSAAKKSGKVQEISVNDRVSVFLELAEAHRMLDEQVRHFVVSLHDSLVRC